MSEKIWLEHYPPQVPHEIDPNAYNSLADFFIQTCKKFSDKPAISNFGVILTYQELETCVSAFAAYLQQDLGLQKGDRIAIMLPNILQFHVAVFGALQAGLIVVNVNPLYTPFELSHQLIDSGATTIVVLANFATTVQQIVSQTSLKHIIVTEMGDLFGFPKKLIMNFIVRHVKKLIPTYELARAIKFTDAIRTGKTKILNAIDITLHDVAFLQYTGGTTGVPKGAMLTHGNLIANMEQAFTWVSACGLKEGGEIVIMPLPLYHVFSLTVCLFCFLKLGTLGVLVTNPRDIPAFMKLLKKTRCSAFVGINSLLNALSHAPGFKELDLSALKFIVAGGMPLQQTVSDLWYEKTGVRVLEGYGLTEASPIVAINPPGNTQFTGSIGLPIPSTDVVFRDENGDKDVPMGEVGELCVKGPQVMRGYWKSPGETRNVFTEDGFLKTGDMGRMDENGLMYLVERKKDMVLVSGFKVYPSEVEAILMSSPEVREAAVIGVPNEKTGERVVAFVVKANKQDDDLTAEKLISYCHQRLTNYKVPKSIIFVDELPKSNIGKVLRRTLKEQFESSSQLSDNLKQPISSNQ